MWHCTNCTYLVGCRLVHTCWPWWSHSLCRRVSSWVEGALCARETKNTVSTPSCDLWIIDNMWIYIYVPQPHIKWAIAVSRFVQKHNHAGSHDASGSPATTTTTQKKSQTQQEERNAEMSSAFECLAFDKMVRVAISARQRSAIRLDNIEYYVNLSCCLFNSTPTWVAYERTQRTDA